MTDEQKSALAALREPFPAEAIDTIPRGNVTLDYVGHAWVTDRLLAIDPLWSWEPFALNEEGAPRVVVRGNQASMWIRLTVLGVTRIGVGTCQTNKEEVEKELIGDAIRNAAMRFGVALDLWKKHKGGDAGGDAPARSGNNRPGKPGGLRLASDKQRALILGLIDERNLTDIELPEDIEQLTMRDASALIDRLQAAPTLAKAARGKTVAEAVEKLADAGLTEEEEGGEEPF